MPHSRTLPIVPARPPAHTPAAPPVERARPPLATDDDIHRVLTAFYDAVGRDAMLAPYFAGLDMAAHMPRIVDFWSTLLFHTGRYSGSAFQPHLALKGLESTHFARWVATLEATVDAHHAGEAAERMKALAHRVAYSMQLRLGITPFTAYSP
jgi:hemoglobin